MIGRRARRRTSRRSRRLSAREARLEVAGALASRPTIRSAPTCVDMAISRSRAGEILGIAGISGNGPAELLAAISRARRTRRPSSAGGAGCGRLGADARRALGLTYVPEDRLGAGAVPPMSLVAQNALFAAHRQGMVHRGLRPASSAEELRRGAAIRDFAVKASGAQAAARSLSGGNLQKFILGREIGQKPKVMVLAQPTWGVDVAATATIRQAVIDLAAGGVAVLVVSEDLNEILEMCDRVAVMAGGRLSPRCATSGPPRRRRSAGR